ncbi:MAG: galactokinase [Anaerolineales bacterium]|nr:galactokinase [Anaerolineales bacterium]
MEVQAEFVQRVGKPPEMLARAPGRVNLLGEHVDYNDGPVLPIALDRTVSLAARRLAESRVVLHALDMGESVAFSLEDLEAKCDLDGRNLPAWALYPAGVAWSLQEAGAPLSGVEVVYRSDVPVGAGLSSSAAVEVAFASLWQALGGWEMERLALAQACQRAENRYVGVSCGLMDQFASACGVKDHALYFDARSLDWEAVPLIAGSALVIADSGVRRSLTTSEYNERRADCEAAVSALRQHLPDIKSLRDVSPIEFAAYGVYLPEAPRMRAEHVVKEIARVHSAVSALQRQDGRALGALMYAGHASLRDLYQVSHPALDALVEIARHIPGCIGARLTGAGFGGCTVNVVEEAHSAAFIQRLRQEYQEKTGLQAQVYACRASDGASARAISG